MSASGAGGADRMRGGSSGSPGRPALSVVMPFAGSRAEAQAALAALTRLDIGPDDELILADNTGVARGLAGARIIAVPGERSPAHARNVGAEHASRDWVLFLDADCEPEPGLCAAYFAAPIAAEVGALAGEVTAEVTAGDALAARYGAARGFLGLGVHLTHPYLPRAAAANLLVRREAFMAVGGFLEGVRAAEDTDFTWRLQRAGWGLVPCPGARAGHHYRTSVRALRRQWRGYAAGRAWLGRRYENFAPEPAARRALRRVAPWGGSPAPRALARGVAGGGQAARPRVSRADRGRFLALDALLGVEELAGFALSNRPRDGAERPSDRAVQVVLVSDRFPERGDPLADYARRLGSARVEAAARPESADPAAGRAVHVHYREDDGAATRAVAALALVIRHPLRAALDRAAHKPDEPTLAALAPAVARLRADPAARVRVLGGFGAASAARRLAALAGRELEGDR
ncbi:MAG: glycosyltransferase [Solirubrobacteraceae bacterium]